MSTQEPTDSVEDEHNRKVLVKGGQVLGYYGARKQRTSLSIQTKLDVIKYAEENPSVTQNKIASHFGIDRTTVSKVLKRKDLFKTPNIDDLKSESNSSVDSQKFPNNNTYDSMHARSDQSTTPGHAVSMRKYNRASRTKSTLAFQYNDDVARAAWMSRIQDNDLYDKCESWFMKQKFTTASKRHQKDIIAYSCLISPLPLSIADCDKIIPAKYVMDEGIQWLYEQIRSTDTSQRGMETFEGKGEELLSKYIEEEGAALHDKLQNLFKSSDNTTEVIARVWRKYVGPKFVLFDDNDPDGINGHSYSNKPLPKKAKLPTTANLNQHIIPLLPANTLLAQSNTLSQQMFLVPTTQTTGPNVVQLAPPVTSSDTPLMPISMMANAVTQPLLASALGLTNGQQEENAALDLSTANVDRGVDLSQKGASVRGSRKRKMNSNPIRIVTPQKDDQEFVPETGDENENDAENGLNHGVNTDEHPELLRCLENQTEYHTMQKYAKRANTEDDQVKNASQHPVIEIIPDSCRSETRTARDSIKMPKYKAAMNICSRSDQIKTAGINCDNNSESLHDLTNNNRALSISTIKGILKNMSLIAKEVRNLKGQVDNSKQKNSETSTMEETKCNCNCNSELTQRVSNLEDKFENMQEKLDKLCDIVMNKE